MKKVIDGKLYNTETAKKIYSFWNGLCAGDFKNESTALYKTKNGNFFLAGEGGAMSRWSRSFGNTSCGGSGIEPLSASDALEWAENHGVEADTIAEHFKVEEA